MKTKTKLFISLLVLLFAIGAIASIVVVVFGLMQQSISTALTVNFTATADVYAKVTGSVHSNSIEYKNIDIDMDGSSHAGNFDIPTITIDPKDAENSAYVDIAITNLRTEGEDEEFIVTPKFTITESENIEESMKLSFDSKNNYKPVEENNICVFKNQTIFLRIQFKALDLALDAFFEGNLSLNLVGISSISSLPEDLCTSTIAATGWYPQDYVGAELNDTLKSANLTENGKTYTTDINGTTKTLTEYTYNGEKFAKLTSALPASSSYNFSTDNIYTILSGATYFFYIQPIRGNLVEIRENNLIFLTKTSLFSKGYDGLSNWVNSNLRNYLNEIFLIESGINAKAITIENSIDSGNYSDHGITADKLWLPSKTELETWYTTDIVRIKNTSDMALATYATNLYYLTRSFAKSYWATIVRNDDGGSISADGSTNNTETDYYGICFAFAI